MSAALKIISSMATRSVLAELVAQIAPDRGPQAEIESVGGVDAARRVQAGEVFDGVVLAANAIEQLITGGRILTGSRIDLFKSGVAIAVRAGAPRPAIGSEAEVKAAVRAARSLSYSTGPSGVALVKLFERWGIAAEIADRIVQAPPGVPVGSLVASGQVDLGFQQLSELMPLDGITVLGPLPPEIQVVTTFSGGVARTCGRPEAMRALLAWLAVPATAATKRRHGMEPA